MKKVLVLCMLVLAACTVRREGGDIDVDPATDRIGNWNATLQPVNNSGVRGSVAARSAVATSGASITISGATQGGQHPWHVHRGRCGDNGPIVGDANAYPVLQVGSNGNASASANLRVGLSEDATYYVNVHRSPANLGTIIACGALTH